MNSAVEHRVAVILSIGDELLLGQTTDTNSAWISGVLTDLGIEVLRHVTVDDEMNRLNAAIGQGMSDADLVILTGGLGPTADDLTRQALCEATDDDLVLDPEAERSLRAWYGERSMPDANVVQAMRPSRARCLPNPHGTAPGLMLTHGSTDVYAFPGPPSEMKPMLTEHMLPRLRPARVVRTAVLHTVGLGESAVASRLGGLMDRSRNPIVGTTASGGIVSVRIRSHGDESKAVDNALESTAAIVRNALGPIVIGSVSDEHATGERGIHALVRELITLMSARGQTLGVCESCTAGLLAATIADVPGSSSAFIGGLISYSNELKTKIAGVEPGLIELHGAVSPQVAAAMARGARERTGATHALSVTGIAGPGGGSDAKPVGTVWIGLDSDGALPDIRRFTLRSDRQAVRHRSVVSALSMLRQRLLGIDAPLLGQAEAIQS